MAITFTQSRSTWPTTSASSTALAYTSNNAAGALLTAFVAWNSNTVTCSLTDTAGNTWQAFGGPQTGAGTLSGWRVQLFYAFNSASGANTVTATFSAAVTRRGIALGEYAGAATSSPTDGSASYTNTVNGSNPFNGPSVSPGGSGDLIVAGVVSSDSVTAVAGGFTLRENTNLGANGYADDITTGAGTFTPSWTLTGSGADNLLVTAAFKSAAASSSNGFAVSGASSGISLAGSFPSAVAVGDLIVVASSRDTRDADTSTDTIADSLGNTYTKLDVANDASNVQGMVWWYSVVTTAGTPTVTVTYPITSAFRAMIAQAFTGLNQAALDQKTVVATPSTSGAGTDNAVTSSITPSTDGCLLVGAINVTHNVNTVAAGTGYTEQEDTGTTVTELEMISATQVTAAATTGKWTITGGAGALYIAGFASFLPNAGVLPVNTVAPTITGSAFVGQTLTVSDNGTWTNSPTSYLYQWQRDDQSTPPVGPGMRDASLATWNAMLPSGMTVVTVTSLSAFNAAYSALPVAGGTLIDVTSPIAMTSFSPRRKFTGLNAIRFCAGCTNTNTIEVESANLALYGLEVKNCLFVNGSYSGHGVAFSNCTNVRWWGLVAHDVAAHCVFVYANVGPNSGLDLDFEAYHCGLDLSRDPHPEPGTGLHPCYIGACDVSNAGNSGKFSITAHDCDTGAVNLGNAIHDSEFWIDARRLNKVATSQVAGNAMQWWSKSGFPNLTNITVHYCYGEDLAGRMSEVDGLPTGEGSNIVVEYARHGGTIRLSPLYLTYTGISYLDCT